LFTIKTKTTGYKCQGLEQLRGVTLTKLVAV